jgi:hypothetical protein
MDVKAYMNLLFHHAIFFHICVLFRVITMFTLILEIFHKVRMTLDSHVLLTFRDHELNQSSNFTMLVP